MNQEHTGPTPAAGNANEAKPGREGLQHILIFLSFCGGIQGLHGWGSPGCAAQGAGEHLPPLCPVCVWVLVCVCAVYVYVCVQAEQEGERAVCGHVGIYVERGAGAW